MNREMKDFLCGILGFAIFIGIVVGATMMFLYSQDSEEVSSYVYIDIQQICQKYPDILDRANIPKDFKKISIGEYHRIQREQDRIENDKHIQGIKQVVLDGAIKIYENKIEEIKLNNR